MDEIKFHIGNPRKTFVIHFEFLTKKFEILVDADDEYEAQRIIKNQIHIYKIEIIKDADDNIINLFKS